MFNCFFFFNCHSSTTVLGGGYEVFLLRCCLAFSKRDAGETGNHLECLNWIDEQHTTADVFPSWHSVNTDERCRAENCSTVSFYGGLKTCWWSAAAKPPRSWGSRKEVLGVAQVILFFYFLPHYFLNRTGKNWHVVFLRLYLPDMKTHSSQSMFIMF